jgi:hypothetical protein
VHLSIEHLMTVTAAQHSPAYQAQRKLLEMHGESFFTAAVKNNPRRGRVMAGYSDSEQDQIRALARAGRTTVEIAKALGRSADGIRDYCRREGVSVKTLHKGPAGYPPEVQEMIIAEAGRTRTADLAEKVGVSLDSLRAWCEGHGVSLARRPPEEALPPSPLPPAGEGHLVAAVDFMSVSLAEAIGQPSSRILRGTTVPAAALAAVRDGRSLVNRGLLRDRRSAPPAERPENPAAPRHP